MRIRGHEYAGTSYSCKTLKLYGYATDLQIIDAINRRRIRDGGGKKMDDYAAAEDIEEAYEENAGRAGKAVEYRTAAREEEDTNEDPEVIDEDS